MGAFDLEADTTPDPARHLVPFIADLLEEAALEFDLEGATSDGELESEGDLDFGPRDSLEMTVGGGPLAFLSARGVGTPDIFPSMSSST